jgi:hypothetical protein
MKRILQSISLMIFVMSATSWSCGQNGPTPITAVLTWTQAQPTATSGPVTGNCIYRGTSANVYAIPALSCSATPITTFIDSTVAGGTTYHYAVTAHFGTPEGPYSNDGPFTAPALSAPVLSTVVAVNSPHGASLIPEAQTQDVTAKATAISRLCNGCAAVSNLVVKLR